MLILVAGSDPILRVPAFPVAAPFAGIPGILKGMWEALGRENGLGLAAPQVGIGQQIAILKVGQERAELINPKIIKASGSKVAVNEGCLSLPGQEFLVPRWMDIYVSYLDRHGKPLTSHFRGLLAQAAQHEIDHLQGLMIDRFKEPLKCSNSSVPYLSS